MKKKIFTVDATPTKNSKPVADELSMYDKLNDSNIAYLIEKIKQTALQIDNKEKQMSEAPKDIHLLLELEIQTLKAKNAIITEWLKASKVIEQLELNIW